MNKVFDRIESPFNNPLIIDNILEAYLTDNGFYSGLVDFYVNSGCGKVVGEINRNYADRFYLELFREWSISLKRIFDSGKYDSKDHDALKQLLEYINNQNPENSFDVLKILSPNDSNLKRILNKYRLYNEQNRFFHIDSSYVHCNREEKQVVEHRLYINCDSNYMHFIAYQFLKKCHDKGLSYYFKFDFDGNRDDNFVVYSDTDHLEKFIEILTSIKNEYNLDSHIYNNPLLTGRIDGWLGYGSEPENSGVDSYNTLRKRHLDDCIRKEVVDYILDNHNKYINVDKKNISISDYIINNLFNELKNDNMSDNFLKMELFKNFDDIIDGINLCDDVDFEYFTISLDCLDTILKKMIIMLRDNNHFKENLRRRIIKTASLYGIDSDNYSVDLRVASLIGKENTSNMFITKLTTTIRSNGLVNSIMNRFSKTGFMNGLDEDKKKTTLR